MEKIDLNDADKKIKRDKIIDLIDGNNNTEIAEIFSNLHPADQAEIISNIDSESRIKLVAAICGIELKFLTDVEDQLKSEIIELLGSNYTAEGIKNLDLDDIVKIIDHLEGEEIYSIIDQLPNNLKSNIKKTLDYPKDSIGRLMDQNFVAINKSWSIGQATKFLQENEDLGEDFYNIILIDDNYSPVAEISLSTIIKHKKNVILEDLIIDDLDFKSINASLNKEEAARYFSKYSLQNLTIINDKGKLVGVISANDVIDIVEDEAEEDILLLAGINDINLHSSNYVTARSRIPWLLLSLIATSFSALIINLFSDQIEKMVILAALLPIVASVAGSAGNQTLTILVRSIATFEIKNIGYLKTIIKEVVVSSINGICLAVIASLLCYIWQLNLFLSFIIFISIFSTVIISCFLGSIIPIILNKLNFDPAISSGVFLTALIDATSFAVFLGFISVISQS